jgi:GTP-binding protein
MGEPFLVSALHGKNIGELLDIITNHSNDKNSKREEADEIPKVALIGKPNVGKSSLLNKLLKKDRVVVHNVAGTTRDSVSEIIKIGENNYEIIDTAGIKKKLYKVQGADYYANIRTNQIIRFSNICILLLDAKDISLQDINLANQITEQGKGLIFAFNKYDLLNEYDKKVFKNTLDKKLSILSWVPHLSMSATTGKNTHKLEKYLELVGTNIQNRISTPQINKFLKDITLKNPPKPIKGKVVKIAYMSQVSTMPTIFTLWCNNKLHINYQRYVINQIRQNFDFQGVPIKLNIKVKR